MRRMAAVNAVVATLLSLGAANAAEITGAGSTFVYPILAKWSADYSVKNGTKVNYQSIGSGGGTPRRANRPTGQ